jgi:cytochrome c-type biogenesis protein CcmH/NrfF
MIVGSFLAGAILTWGLPVALVVAIGIYWTVLGRRKPEDL